MKTLHTHQFGRAIVSFTLIELLVVISIIMILVSLLMPVLAKARDSGKKAGCLNNLKQFGMTNNMYVSDNQGCLPFSRINNHLWDYLLMGYVYYDKNNCNKRTDFSIFHCPAGIPNKSYSNYTARGYGYNQVITYDTTYSEMSKLSRIKKPAITVLMTDWANGGTEGFTLGGTTNGMFVSYKNGNQYISYRHFNQTNILFADFHVKSSGRGFFSASYGGWIPLGTQWYNTGTIY
ncbi:MAG: type II secretion system protein [Victivallaceae bacterium]|nr:type II secretion system protein [Victivallaceae bacterium]